MPELDRLSRHELIALLVGFHARVEELTAENAELRAALAARGGGSGGSGAAPTWGKPNRPAREDAGGPKPRKKRVENRARKLSEPTEKVIHRLDRCPDCGHRLPEGTLHRVREVIDLPAPWHIVRHHLIYRSRCGVFGGTRSPRGSQTMAILQTLFGTWSLRGLDPLEACMAMLASA